MKQEPGKLILRSLLALLAILAAATARADYDSEVSTDTPLYSWEDNLTATAGGVSWNLTGASTNQAGQLGSAAVSFTGNAGSYAKTASAIDLSGVSTVTVEAIVKFPAFNNTDDMAWELTAHGSSTAGGFFFDPNAASPSGKMYVLHRALTGGGTNSATYSRPTADAWHHVVVIYDQTQVSASEITLYVDGTLQTIETRPQTTNNTGTGYANAILNLASRNGTGLYCNMVIERLAIYSGALSSTRIGDHYNAAFGTLTAGTVTESYQNSSSVTFSFTAATNVSGSVTNQAQYSTDYNSADPGSATWNNVTGATATGTNYTVNENPVALRVAYTDDDETVYSDVLEVETIAYRDLIQGDSPLYYWPMDETSGTTMTALVGGVNGTYSNVTLNQSGQVDGGAPSFNGTSSSASVALDLSAHSKIYVECLVYWPSYANTSETLLEFTSNASTTSGGFAIVPNASNGFFQALHCGDVGSATLNGPRPAAGRWSYVVRCFDYTVASNAEITAWLDGITGHVSSRAGSNNASGTTYANSTLYIGSRAGSSRFAPNGAKIQHLAIYSALSEAQIYSHAVTAGFTPTVAWDVDDLIGNGRDGDVDQPKYNALSVLKFTSDCSHIRIKTEGSSAVVNRVRLRVDGSDVAALQPSPVDAYLTYSVGNGGTSRTYEIVNGTQSGTTGVATSYAWLTDLDVAGGTSIAIVPPSSSNVVVVYGDSITVGTATTAPERDAPVSVLRNTYSRNTIAEGWDGRALSDHNATAGDRTAMAARIASYNPTYVYVQIGVNDYIRRTQSSANFGTMYADFLDKLHAAAPSAVIICQTMTPMTDESELQGGYGVLEDYRDQVRTAVGARAWAVLADADTEAWITTGDLVDTVHPSTAGAATLAQEIDAVLTANAPSGVTAGTLSVDSKTNTTVTLSWTDATGGTPPYTYDIEQSPQGAETWTTVATDVTSPYTVTGLSPNTAYDFRLKVTDSAPMMAGPAITRRRRRLISRRKQPRKKWGLAV